MHITISPPLPISMKQDWTMHPEIDRAISQK